MSKEDGLFANDIPIDEFVHFKGDLKFYGHFSLAEEMWLCYVEHINGNRRKLIYLDREEFALTLYISFTSDAMLVAPTAVVNRVKEKWTHVPRHLRFPSVLIPF